MITVVHASDDAHASDDVAHANNDVTAQSDADVVS
jgi:hypothetical protein